MVQATKQLQIKAVIFQEGDWWVGQWLEYDIAAQAKTVKDLINEMHRTLIGHFAISQKEGLPLFGNLKRAPDQFWKLYETGLKIDPPKTDFPAPGQMPSINPEMHLVA